MANLYKDYPYGLEDKTLEAAVAEYSQATFAAKADINAVLQFSPLIQLGQYELQKRASERSNRFATRISYASLGLGGLALLISVANTWSSSRWEEKQLEAIGKSNAGLSVLVEEQRRVLEQIRSLPSETGQAVAAALPKPPVSSPSAANKSLKGDVAKATHP